MFLFNKRNVFFLVDLLIFILGLTIAGVGIWVLGDETIGRLSEDEPFAATSIIYKSAYIVITFGFTLTILGLVGCFAVFFEKSLILCCFAAFFAVPLLLLIAALSLAWYASEDHSVQEEMENQFNKQWKSQKFFGAIERRLQCCGVKTYAEYGGTIPISCMIDNSTIQVTGTKAVVTNTTGNSSSLENIHQKGCIERFQEELRQVASVLSGLSTTIVILMTIAVILALGIRHGSQMPPDTFPEIEK